MALNAAGSWEQTMARCRRLLARWLRDSSGSRSAVADILEALEELDRLYRSVIAAEAVSARPPKLGDRQPSRRDLAKRFQVERTHRGLYLAERFSSTRLPFRCPEHIYFAVIKVMEANRSPTSFEAILGKVRAMAKEALPDYLPRVCIRFWLATQPPLLEKVRACYRPIHPSQFGRDARRAWKELADKAE